MIVTTEELGVDEALLEPLILLVKTCRRVRRTGVMQCDKVGLQVDVDETALVTGSCEVFERVDRVREFRVIGERENKAGELPKAERMGRNDSRGEVPVEPGRFDVLEEPRSGLPAEADRLVA